MKIKRLITGGLAAVAAGATLIAGGLAASTFDQGVGQFVTITDSTLSSPVIVVGAGVDTTDVIGAADIAASLVSNYAVKETAIPSTGGIATVSDGVLIRSDLNRPYLTKNFTSIKSTITKTDLATLLATQEFTDMNATSITYTQQIKPGIGFVSYGTVTGETEPNLYTEFSSSYTYNLTVMFLGGLDTSAVDTSYKLKLFNKDYTFGSIVNNQTITLFSSTGAATLSLSGVGDEESITVGGTSYTFKLLGWGHETETNPGAFLQVNGVATTPTEWRQASTYTIPGTTTKVYVNSVSVISTGGTEKSVSAQLFVGTDKLKLEDGVPVEKNDVGLVNTMVDISASGSKVNSISIQIAPDVSEYLLDGKSFVDPVFGSFKWVISGMTPGFKDATRDLVKVGKDGTNKVKLTFKNKEGTQYAVNPFYYDSGWEATIDGTHEFHLTEMNLSTNQTNVTVGDYFVLTAASNKASYIYKYSSYYPSITPSARYVTVADVSTGQTQKIYYNQDPYIRIGADSFMVSMRGYTTDYAIGVDFDGDGTIQITDVVDIYTEGEAVINLQNMNNVLITETPLYQVGNDPAGEVINVTAAYDAATYVSFTAGPAASISVNQIGTSNKYRGVSDYGTYVETDTDADTVDVYTPGNRPAYANIAVGTNPVISVAGGTSGTYKEAVPVTNPIAKFPSEISQTSSLDKHLILVGGPCANAIVKDILNSAWSVSDSCAAWGTDADLKDAGKGLVKIVEGVFGSGKNALIVAGSTAADTRNLIANKVIKPTVFNALSGAEYKGTVA
jgi:hypothetical protein